MTSSIDLIFKDTKEGEVHILVSSTRKYAYGIKEGMRQITRPFKLDVSDDVVLKAFNEVRLTNLNKMSQLVNRLTEADVEKEAIVDVFELIEACWLLLEHAKIDGNNLLEDRNKIAKIIDFV